MFLLPGTYPSHCATFAQACDWLLAKKLLWSYQNHLVDRFLPVPGWRWRSVYPAVVSMPWMRSSRRGKIHSFPKTSSPQKVAKKIVANVWEGRILWVLFLGYVVGCSWLDISNQGWFGSQKHELFSRPVRVRTRPLREQLRTQLTMSRCNWNNSNKAFRRLPDLLDFQDNSRHNMQFCKALTFMSTLSILRPILQSDLLCIQECVFSMRASIR